MNLWNWLRFWRRPGGGTGMQVVLYTRQGCHLCEDALAILRASQRRHGFQLDIRDVDGDPEMLNRYSDCVPVVLVQGKVRFRGRVNPVLLERLLRGIERQQEPRGESDAQEA